ncbi:hypothetical protein H7H37_12780, partial [Mycolicibacterium insubricum]|nr:hypothetical protein [Mycolicibacterium insubricum]
AAFRDGGDWLDLLLADLVSSRALLADLLGEHLPGVGYRQPEGAYLAWLGLPRSRDPGVRRYAGGILRRPGESGAES